jgi:hypothetical protein
MPKADAAPAGVRTPANTSRIAAAIRCASRLTGSLALAVPDRHGPRGRTFCGVVPATALGAEFA